MAITPYNYADPSKNVVKAVSGGSGKIAPYQYAPTPAPANTDNSFLGIAKNTVLGLSDAATTVGSYIGNKIIDAAGGLAGATPAEVRNPQILKDTALGLPSSLISLDKQLYNDPVGSIAGAVGGATRGIADTVTNAIINLTPTSVTGTDRDSLKSAVSDTLDKYLGATPQNAFTAGFKQAGQGAPALLAGGVGDEVAGGLGMTAGFLGTGQTQQPLDANIQTRADQAMSDLVGLGLFKIGSDAYLKAKSYVTEGITKSGTVPPGPDDGGSGPSTPPEAPTPTITPYDYSKSPTEQAPVAPQEAPTATEQPKGDQVTKAAKDISDTLVKHGFDALTPDQQAKFTSGSYKDSLAKVSQMLAENADSVKEMAKTGENIPADVHPQILFNAVEALANKTGDVDLLQDLAKSPLASSLSESGSTLGSHGFNDNPNSVVARLREIKDALVKKVGGGKKIAQARTSLKAETQKVNLSKDDLNWDKFLDTIKC